MRTYSDFLHAKTDQYGNAGFDPVWIPDFLFDFQRHLVEWAVRKGRAAIFADCGMGKTPMQLVWAENVRRHTGKPVLILTALAVAQQIVEEAEKFGIPASRSSDGTHDGAIVVTNYDRIHHFRADDFGGIVADESSILKSFDGSTRAIVTEYMKRVPYRLLATATAAPNDYTELGTSSEALGYLGHMDMLGRFFVNDQGNSSHRLMHRKRHGYAEPGTRWRFKGHAEENFWRWVASWARALRRPSDFGFSDDRFHLPALTENEHLVRARVVREGYLYELPANGLHEEREEMRRTIDERCRRAADLANATDDPVVLWCHLNDEADLLEKLVVGARQVSGSDSPEEKESAFSAFAHGKVRAIVCKPKIGAWGLNWQHCNRVVYFPSHSYEQYYQAVRRCWRFGQKRPVTVDIVTTEGGSDIMRNLKRKAVAADEMFSALVRHMNDALAIDKTVNFNATQEVPSWL